MNKEKKEELKVGDEVWNEYVEIRLGTLKRLNDLVGIARS
jgi:hypothetical protein